jgi:hypothetical protein
MKTIAALGYYVVFILLLVTISLWELHELWINRKKTKKSKILEKRKFFWKKYHHKQPLRQQPESYWK